MCDIFTGIWATDSEVNTANTDYTPIHSPSTHPLHHCTIILLQILTHTKHTRSEMLVQECEDQNSSSDSNCFYLILLLMFSHYCNIVTFGYISSLLFWFSLVVKRRTTNYPSPPPHPQQIRCALTGYMKSHEPHRCWIALPSLPLFQLLAQLSVLLFQLRSISSATSALSRPLSHSALTFFTSWP